MAAKGARTALSAGAAALLLAAIAGGAKAAGEPVRLQIVFASACCGTDHQALREVSRLVAAAGKHAGRPLAQQRVAWGKEGEFNLCLPLTELDPGEQQQLAERLGAALRASRLTTVIENAPCAAASAPRDP